MKTSKKPRKPTRRASINKLRRDITETYHALSHISCEDSITTKPAGKLVMVDVTGDNPPIELQRNNSQLDEAIDLLSAAINCLNHEVGRKESSPA